MHVIHKIQEGSFHKFNSFRVILLCLISYYHMFVNLILYMNLNKSVLCSKGITIFICSLKEFVFVNNVHFEFKLLDSFHITVDLRMQKLLLVFLLLCLFAINDAKNIRILVSNQKIFVGFGNGSDIAELLNFPSYQSETPYGSIPAYPLGEVWGTFGLIVEEKLCYVEALIMEAWWIVSQIFFHFLWIKNQV